ncbi:unannotated protein [freshwater metagenome]|uniref:Unannotated protein n=1 Tax=freshwater metagenome TaxID=449393 RepID=A0A6J6QIB1_9ZZZZ
MAGLVAHHVAKELLEERLSGELVEEAEGCERESLHHHLHPEVRHVPATVVHDVVEEHPEVGVHLIAAAELFVDVAGEHLDVACLVDHLSGGVQLRVVPRNGLGDLCCADQRALLAVEELAECPPTALHAEFHPLLGPPLLHRGPDVHVGVHTRTERCLIGGDGGLEVDISVPCEVGGAVPLAGLGLLVEPPQCRALQRVVPSEDGVGVVLDDVLDLINVGVGDGEDGLDVVEVRAANDVFGGGHGEPSVRNRLTVGGQMDGTRNAGSTKRRVNAAACTGSERSTSGDGARK